MSQELMNLEMYLNGLNNQELVIVSGILGMLGGAVISITFIFAVAIWIIEVVAKYKLFQKMGVEGWKSIIPFYNDYIMYDKTWTGKAYLLYILVEVISVVVSRIMTPSLNVLANQLGNGGTPDNRSTFVVLLFTAVLIVLAIIQLVILIKAAIYVAKSFGRSGLFAAVYFLFPFIALLLIGYGSDKYKGNSTKETIEEM